MLQWIHKNLKTAATTTIMLGVILGAVFCIFPDRVLAQSIADPNSELQQGMNVLEQPLGLPATDIRVIIANIIKAALGLLGIVLVVMTIYAGFLWMTAAGNETQVGEAKKMLINLAIGLAIILSAYSIVSFVMNKLLEATSGTGGEEGAGGPPQTQNFQGSGALSKIIKDHYPMRDETDVPRSAKIIITFRQPVLASSFITDTTGDGVFGNCIDNIVNWRTDCDQLVMDSSHMDISKIVTGADGAKSYESISALALPEERGAAALASGAGGKTTSITIRPNVSLGNNTENISYLVHLGAEIRLDDAANDNPRVSYSGDNKYEWQFTCGTALDTSAPVVQSVYPADGGTEMKNSVIQINFSEPMDPYGIQGAFSANDPAGENYYYAGNRNIFLKTNNSTIPLGSFNLVNGYRTLEFTPTKECGQNACGGKIFCLPVCDKSSDSCAPDTSGVKNDVYTILLKSGIILNSGSFEARPSSGFMDISGNALDGDKDGQPDMAPTTGLVFDTWKKADNFYWSFTLKDAIDDTAPWLREITPGIDAENVISDQPWRMLWSKRMRVAPMYDIRLDEFPVPAVPLWKVPRVSFDDATGNTTVEMSHGPFVNTARVYYIPALTSSLEDVNFNCFYPGRGPNGTTVNADGAATCGDNGAGCCAVLSDPVERAFCCNGMAGGSNLDSCINQMKSP